MQLLLVFVFSIVVGLLSQSPAVGQSADKLKALNERVIALYNAGKYVDAIPLAVEYAEGVKSRFGENHPQHATALNNLAQLLTATNRLVEAEQLMRRTLKIDEDYYGSDHASVALALNNLAQVLQATNRLAEAEPLMRRALGIDEKQYGPDDPSVGTGLNNLAMLLKENNRLVEAETLMRRSLPLGEKHFGGEHPTVANRLGNLAKILRAMNRLADAEPLWRRALAMDEKHYGPEHPKIAIDLNNLAELLRDTNRTGDAELLIRRALSINERSHGPEHPAVAATLSNLAALLKDTNRRSEAEPLMRRALLIDERYYGSEHPTVAIRLSSLGQLLQFTGRMIEAEQLMRRALAIDEKTYGTDHPELGVDLNNLAQVLRDMGRASEAEPLMQRALVIAEKSLGPEHPKVAISLGNLAVLRAELGDWASAADLARRAKPILVMRNVTQAGAYDSTMKGVLARNTWQLRGHARSLYRADPTSPRTMEEAFELAQWALQTGAADALSQMSARFAKGIGPLSQLMRQRQDFTARRADELHRLDAAAGRSDRKGAEEAHAAVAALDQSLDIIDDRLKRDFQGAAELANPKPLSIAEVQGLLEPYEAMVLFLDLPQFGKLLEESLSWVITKETVRWHSIPIGTRALWDRVTALRCGLDTSSWDNASGWPETTELDKQRVREQQARRERCKQLLATDVTADEWPPFDLAKSHQLYEALLAPFAEVIRGKHLIVVPSGALSSLPFHVLVTEPPRAGPTGMAAYRQAAWLALQQAVTVLPSVGSLQALRRLGPSQAASPYIGIGNPLLLGGNGNDRSAWDKQKCGQQEGATRVAEARRVVRGAGGLRAIDLAELRTQTPLPETADELCAVAEALGSLAQQSETVWLGERATERNLKALSREGRLARYKVVHFATHGLLSGESEAILKAKAEPALIMTPPKDGTTPAELEEDDGLLTASEVAQLELDADWVVLSACNTAAGETGDAEALSGLARAFFYAKARALLVSHWYVSSVAAVKLTTKAFAELKANPSLGRAEALRRSMVDIITTGGPHEAHPSIWAPFVLVGEGAR